MLLIDFSGIAHAMTVISWDNTVKAIQTEYMGIDTETAISDDDFIDRFTLEFKARVLTILLQIKRNYSKSNEEIVIAIDSKLNWRKKEFPYYKANRKVNRDKDIIDWPLAYNIRNEFIDDLKENFLFKIIKYEDMKNSNGCEADDIIAILARYKEGREEITIISDDSDFYQLHDIENLSQYNYKSVQKTWEHAAKSLKIGDDIKVTPKEFVQLKILNGDRKDGVPNFLSDSDVWVNENKKLVRLGGKTSLKILREDDKMVSIHGYMNEIEKLDNYKRNKSVIDLSMIPEEIKNNVINQYLTYEYKGSISDIIRYLSTKVNISSPHLINAAEEFQIKNLKSNKRRRRSIYS